jgi:hypothetical protein
MTQVDTIRASVKLLVARTVTPPALRVPVTSSDEKRPA